MNKKIIVSTLALAMGAALAGSVSGTVAWFQYSTRAQAAFIGTTAHCSEMLEIQATAVGADPAENGWKTELLASDIATASNETSSLLTPITTGAMAKNDALPKVITTPDNPDTDEYDPVYGTDPAFYSNPIYQHFEYNKWEKATAANYIQFDLHLRVRDVNGSSDLFLPKDVYLQNLSIVSLNDAGNVNGNAEDENSDLYKAIRVHFACASKNALFANDGVTTSATDIETLVSDKLDLNNDKKLDTTEAYSDWQTGEEKFYGGAEGAKQVAYNVNEAGLFADDSDPTLPDAAHIGTLGSLGATTASANVKITVTIWLEGWQQFGETKYTAAEAAEYNEAHASEPGHVDVQEGDVKNAANAIWDPATYIAKRFGVGMRFVVPAHTAAQ